MTLYHSGVGIIRAENDLEALMAVFTLGMSVYTGRVVALGIHRSLEASGWRRTWRKLFKFGRADAHSRMAPGKYPGCFTSALLVRSRNAPERKARSSANDQRGQGGAPVSCIPP